MDFLLARVATGCNSVLHIFQQGNISEMMPQYLVSLTETKSFKQCSRKSNFTVIFIQQTLLVVNAYYVWRPALIGETNVSHGTRPKRGPIAVVEAVRGVNNDRVMWFVVWHRQIKYCGNTAGEQLHHPRQAMMGWPLVLPWRAIDFNRWRREAEGVHISRRRNSMRKG